ncbi:hypothetical protein [Leeuwenhoekiella nanhaiensis]|uniref:Glycosyltransferase RgtA/B/C/D-like domain-containing protein n=1 Tax=Leeuwenhoekiella nanhaiensis TaxID=1655491 RepID=A0A2G1VVF0_9FLAO|nr:hypothetical protein [Leeuwenhoekiella nanhaiensis]PHQ30757.1 hypothetical protein CJ305_00575 [Leeuwenhoekiella nanhaiensis]
MSTSDLNNKPVLINKDHLFFMVLAFLAVLLAMLAPMFLPGRFYNDARIITLDLYNEIGWIDSYPLTMAFYKYTGLRLLPYWLVGFIQLTILFWALFKIGVPNGFSRLSLKNALVWISFFILAIYTSMPSKEFINFLVVALIPGFLYKIYKSQSRFAVLSCLLLIVFGLLFRVYFVLIPVLSLLFYGLGKLRLKTKIAFVFGLGIFAVIVMSLSYSFIKGPYLSEISREAVNNERRFSPEAASMIEPPLNVNTWYGEAVSISYGFFTVNVPVNGLKFLGKPQILAFVIWQLMLFAFLIWGFANSLRKQQTYPRMLWIFYFLMAYFIVQGVFEPDLGSAIKHKIGILPLIYVALYYDYFRKDIPV